MKNKNSKKNKKAGMSILGMYVAPYKYRPSFSVDTYSDLKLVNRAILKDPLTKKY